jgi:hypothetical protein
MKRTNTLAVPSEVLIEFEDGVDYFIPKHKQRPALWALNKAYVGKETIPLDEPCPMDLQMATHAMLCTYRKRVLVTVYKDGSISLKIKE